MTLERYSEIEEHLPVRVTVTNSDDGFYCLSVPPMSMTYETYTELGTSNQRLTDEQWEYQKEHYPPDETLDIRRKYQNDVSVLYYDYHNGDAMFTASTKEDVDNWFKLHAKYIIENK